MTENQIYPIPADFFDNSSNSSNLLKLDIFPNDFIITNSNSNSNNSIIGLTNLSTASRNQQQHQQHQQQQQQQQQQNLSALSPQQQYSNTSMDSLRENPMLGSTASIQIPQRTHSNNSSGGGIISGLLTSGSNSNSSNILNIKYNNSQPPRIEADFSEYGLDALEAHSYSPNLLHDQLHNLHNNSQHNSHNHHNNSNNIQLVNTSNNGNTIGGNNNHSTTTQPISTTTPTSTITNGDGEFITIYEIPNSNTNSNTMWSDIGNAMITTKSEPFNMDDDYIFQIDKSDLIQGPTLSELNDETILEDLILEDYMHNSGGSNSGGGGSGSGGGGNNDNYLIGSPNSQLHQLQSSSVDSGGSGNCSNVHSPENSGSMPPQQLLQQQNHINQQQQQQQQQFSQQHHPQQQQQQQQQQQFQQHGGGLHLNINRNSGGRYNERTNTGGSSSPYDIYHSTPTKSYNTNAAFSPGSQASSSPLLMNSVTPPPPPHSNHRSQFQQNRPNRTALHDLLSKKDYSQSPDRHILGQSVPGPSTSMLMAGTALSPASSSGFGSSSSGRKQISFTSAGGASAAAAAGVSGLSRLSSSAPTHLGLEQIWQRREPRQHLLSTGSLVEAESFSSISTGSVLSPEANDFSHDEGYSDYDSDHYEDYSSDGGSDNDDDTRTTSNPNSSNKNKERYFWQYNVQAKGPKGQRLVIKTQLEDPHVLNEVTDPVFSPNCSVRGIKHSGKARKGDGNDLTPNPRKLHVIGKELDKLGRTINDMIPVSELPFNVRPKSRKEKNKLASRACRLKKKAQHEANKIKLFGLEIEHKKLLNGISDCKRILAVKYQNQNPNQSHPDNVDELNNKFDTIAQQSTTVQIAGNSTDFVNKILDKVKAGQPSGGLEDLKTM